MNQRPQGEVEEKYVDVNLVEEMSKVQDFAAVMDRLRKMYQEKQTKEAQLIELTQFQNQFSISRMSSWFSARMSTLLLCVHVLTWRWAYIS